MTYSEICISWAKSPFKASVRMLIFHAYFLVYSSVGNRGKQTFGWLQIMESFSLISRAFLLLMVRFLVWKVGGCLLLTIKVFVLFEKGLGPDSTASACKLPYSLCSYVWSPNSTRKKWFMRLCLLLLLIKSVSSKTNLWSLADLVTSSRYWKISVNCKRKFDCGAENDSPCKLYSFPPNLSSSNFHANSY